MKVIKENAIVTTLGDTLEELQITKNFLAVESKVRPATIGDLVNGKAKAIQFDTLTAVINALNRIALEQGKTRRYDVNDVFVFKLTEKGAE
ncbi:helix-turn-helix domain-containing protein [Cytobacillus oceanisediminis]|uniref:Control protein n=1 Tax=Cytobacillus oceanisediminis 2691 TaxID=1196031 RepID=A0A160MAS0_9BACI|nr:hypothetical protein [Cytobacillus oceanisediminis]AND39593.1 control protein [Cytobacillus oceanisediminis 2691]